jgi:2-polyprenyl-6-methoxyphenol hydroxylase-like FAD-dependent oxidoreductase
VTGRQVGDRAVVLGAGVAGLLAARVLSEAFAEVLVLDRDQLSPRASDRSGARHAHLLLGRGQQILQELFPGFTEDLVAAGAPTADFGTLRTYVGGRPLQPGSTGALCVPVDRSFLDAQLLARVRALPAVRFAAGTDVLGLVCDAEDERVRGVRTRPGASGGEEVIEADLVVDATGRNSATPDWLAEIGYDRPREDRIPVGLSFTTGHYRLRDRRIGDGAVAVAVEVTPGPDDRRGALLLHLGGGRCVLTLTAPDERMPTDPAELVEWTRTLAAPEIPALLAGARPLEEVVTDRFETSLRRRYEQLDRLPERLLVLGEAACGINPVHRQGITVAAQQALSLREHLQYGMPQPLVFAKDVSAGLDVPWNMAAGTDLSLAGIAGACGEDVEVDAAFLAKVRAGATRDPVLTRALIRVTGLLDSPETLMTPDIVARAMRPGKWRP